MKLSNTSNGGRHSHLYVIVLVVAASIYLGTVISPPSLMDDVDAVQAAIARNMLVSGDWVTAHIDGLVYLEKPPLIYWTIAASYRVFGQHDWAARIPIALSAIALAALTMAFGIWAFGNRGGFYAGLCISTCTGLFLFTRILIPDAMLTFTVALAMWAFLRALEREEQHPRFWSIVLAACLGIGMLLKSLISVLIPAANGLIYLLFTRQLFSASTWKRLHPFTGALIALAIAAPWHILATVRNPPYFDFTLHAGPGQYHGFLWFFFFNEQVLRFLNLRYPHDYNTVPRLWFWLLHLVWLFPWSVYLPAVAKLSFKPGDRAGRARLLALVWIGFLLVFFTFSTTQEYYSMPTYPAFALLLGSAMAMEGAWARSGTRALWVIAASSVIAVVVILIYARGMPTPGDISAALGQHPEAATLSMGHMLDLTLHSFAYLRLPLMLTGVACLVGVLGTLNTVGQRAFLATSLMMILFFHAARIAMTAFDPFLSSRPLADALLRSPDGTLVAQGHYYEFASVFFYTDRDGFLSSDQRVNLEYGSYAPRAPRMFIDDDELKDLWLSPRRAYLLTAQSELPHYRALLGADRLQTIAASGGKVLLANRMPPGASSSTSSKPG